MRLTVEGQQIHVDCEGIHTEGLAEGPEKKYLKKELKKHIYRVMHELTKAELPWGALTGIRPTKLIVTMIEAAPDVTDEEITSFLKENYYVTDEKAALGIQIARREIKLLEKIDYEEGYSLYIGIPFCPTTCLYCSFTSYPIGAWKGKTGLYLDALFKELSYTAEKMKGRTLDTVYFGGGTPSQLEKEDFELIFETIRTHYGLNHCQEITLEANPDDLTSEYLGMLSSLPFNRLSMGIQTFDDNTLKLLKRRHNARAAIEAVSRCREAGFRNISIDLIYGLPGETKERWENDLRQAIALNVEHISAYHLIYEEDTLIYKMLKQHRISEVDEDSSLEFFTLLIEELQKAGFEHYEISNFCRPDKYSRHNTSYWKGIPYLGCGPSAHSFDGATREWNISSIDAYIKGIEEHQRAFEIEYLDQTTRYNEFIITTIRTTWGAPIEKLKQMFGNEMWEYCRRMAAPYLDNGKLEEHNGALRLTRKGIFISDSIMSDLLWVDN